MRIADVSLPFAGSWTYDVTPSGSGTRVLITERGEIHNPVFRVLSRFVFGHTATMEQFLRNLGQKLDYTRGSPVFGAAGPGSAH